MSGLVPVIVAIAVFVGLAAIPKLGGISIDASRAGIFVRLRGLNKVWALKGTIAIPAERINRISAVARKNVQKPRARTLGTGIPWILAAGRFRTKTRRSFWFVRRAEKLLVIGTDGHPFDEIVLEVERPHAVADKLNASLGRPGGPDR